MTKEEIENELNCLERELCYCKPCEVLEILEKIKELEDKLNGVK